MKLKVKYIDGTTDEIILYTEKPTKPALTIFGDCCIDFTTETIGG